MLRRSLVLVLAACGASKIPVRMGDPKVDPHDDTTALAECAPTKRVIVTDPNGAPVANALVFVRQVEHTNCPSMGPAAPLYTTAPVRTDGHGVATTCDPEAFFADKDVICPHHRDAAAIVVIAGDRAAKLEPPFASELRAVVAPCAELLARDPQFPCRAVDQ